MSKLEFPDHLKYLRALRYIHLSLMDFNSIELEDVLPGLFYLIRCRRQRGQGQFGKKSSLGMAQELCASGLVDNECGEAGEGVLEAWLRASILRLARHGRKADIMSVRPLHFMSYRVDLPSTWSHLRSVPEFVAAVLTHNGAKGNGEATNDKLFPLGQSENLFYRTFGIGMESEFPASLDKDTYDEDSELDIESLLLVRLMQLTKPPAPITSNGEVRSFEPLCPGRAEKFRQDFSTFLRNYSPREIPPRVLGEFVMALLSLNLTIYFVEHCLSANKLYETGVFDNDKRSAGHLQWEPAIFVDLTNGKNRKCRDLAKASYQRHMRIISQHLRTMVGFRIIERVLHKANDIPEIAELTRQGKMDVGNTITYLEAFARARLDPGLESYRRVQAHANGVIADLADHDKRNKEVLDASALETLTPFDRLIEAVVTSDLHFPQQTLKFHGDIARAGHRVSILGRTSLKRLDTYYTLTSGMLEMLIQMVPLRPQGKPSAREMDVYEFIDMLRERYGIWIDKPPPEIDDSVEAHQAADANVLALKETLRQLGALRALTDARGMQTIIPRYQARRTKASAAV